ncbi:MAG: hypothetical protein HY823_04225 [Acidobacteria bacterium]|nr:hypothetical protein [Acidobacteriota bacterium]
MPVHLRHEDLGQAEAGFETRIEWEGPGRLNPVVYTRPTLYAVQAEISGPEEFLDSAWNDIAACVRVAGAIAGLPGLRTTPSSTLEAFEQVFYTCLASRWPQDARKVKVGLSSRLQSSVAWQRGLH